MGGKPIKDNHVQALMSNGTSTRRMSRPKVRLGPEDEVSRESLRQRLEELGFRRRRQLFGFPLGDGFEGWLGLNQATRGLPKGQASIFPIVGLRDEEVESWLIDAGFAGKANPFLATVGMPLRYLMPEAERRDWIIDERGDDDEAALLTAIVTYGVPYMHRMADREAIVRQLAEERDGFGDAEVRIPLLLLAMGRPADALRSIESAREWLAPQSGPAAEMLEDLMDWETELINRTIKEA